MVLVVLPSWPTSCVFDQSLVRLTLRFRQQQKKPKIFFRSTKLEAGLRTKWLARAQRNAIEKNREIEPAANSVACPPVGASLRARNEEREREKRDSPLSGTVRIINQNERRFIIHGRCETRSVPGFGRGFMSRDPSRLTPPVSSHPLIPTHTHTHTHAYTNTWGTYTYKHTHTHTHTQPHSWLPPVFRIHRPRLHLRGH